MKFDDLDARMRVFETAQDFCVLPEIFVVARLDGRGFTRLTKEIHKFDAPYDERFRDHMIATVMHLMNCGLRIVFGYTQSDEISLLFHRNETLFDRKLRKWISVLAGEASATLSLCLGGPACLDCRISQLPTMDLVVEYFRWRQEDAVRNALNSHCYWMLRKEGNTATKATKALLSLRVSDKNELLFQRGINFNKLPLWQRRGSGLYWEKVAMEGVNRKSGEAVSYTRRKLRTDLGLPTRDDYEDFLRQRLAEAMEN